MKYTLALAIATATLATAQLDQVPPCASSCLLPALSADGCTLTDFKCHCSNPNLISSVTPCVQKACSVADVARLIAGVSSLCGSYGVTLALPTNAAPTTVVSTVVSVPVSTTALASSSSHALSSSVAASSTAVVGSSSAAVTTAVATTTTAAAGNGSMPSSPTVVPFPGGASYNSVGTFVVGLALAFAGVVVL